MYGLAMESQGTAWLKHFTQGSVDVFRGERFPAQGLVRILRGSYPELPRVPTTGVALDVGCGDGRNAKFLHDSGFDVTAIEISADLVHDLQQRYVGVRFVVGVCESLPLVAAYSDLTVAWHSAYYISSARRFLDEHISEIARVTKPRGIAIVAMPMPSSFIFHGAEREYTDVNAAVYYRIRNDPFLLRNGTILATFPTDQELRSCFARYFPGEISIGEERGDWFGLQYDWWVVVARR
jgi:SAM-dependent methyltransferase